MIDTEVEAHTQWQKVGEIIFVLSLSHRVYERNEASARGRYIGEFPHREKGQHNKASTVRPDTPPTPGATGPEAHPATPVTPGTPVVGVPADGSPEPSGGQP